MKALIQWILSIPIGLLAWIEGRRKKRNLSEFSSLNMILAGWPGRLGDMARYQFYRKTLKRVGNHVHFKYGSYCQYYECAIGDHVFFGYFNAIGQAEIGNDVIIGGYVNLVSGRGQHGCQRGPVPFWQQPGRGRKTISIGNNVWIGSNCCITTDIGNNCILGAGSVLIKPMEDYSIYGGNPAKKIGEVSSL